MGNKKTEETRESVDCEDLLFRLSLPYKKLGSNLWLRCQSGRHPDRKPSFQLTSNVGKKDNGLGHCFSCKWGCDVFSLVQKVKKFSFSDSVEFVEKSVFGNFWEGDESDESYNQIFGDEDLHEERKPKGLKKIIPGSECMQYLADRGFGNEVIKKYGLRDWVKENRVYIPVRMENKLILWVARTYVDSIPKVLTPKDSKGSKFALFGWDFLDREKRRISLTEGWASAIRVTQANFSNSLAACGSKLSIKQAEKLLWVKRIIFWLEGDEAGEQFLTQTREWLGRGRKIDVVELPAKKDPADYSPEKLIKFYNRRKRA